MEVLGGFSFSKQKSITKTKEFLWENWEKALNGGIIRGKSATSSEPKGNQKNLHSKFRLGSTLHLFVASDLRMTPRVLNLQMKRIVRGKASYRSNQEILV